MVDSLDKTSGSTSGLLVGTVQEGFWCYLTGWRSNDCESLVSWGFCGHVFPCFKHVMKTVTLKGFSHRRERDKQERQCPIITEHVTQFGHTLARVAAPGSQQGAPPFVLPRTVTCRTAILVIAHLALLTTLSEALLLLVGHLWAHRIPHTQTGRFLEGRTVWDRLAPLL